MPLSPQTLERKLLSRLFTPRTTYAEVFQAFQAQADPVNWYAIVRVGAEYTVLTLRDLETLWPIYGPILGSLALADLPELRLFLTACPPLSQALTSDAEAQEVLDQLIQSWGQTPTEAGFRAEASLVVVDAQGVIQGVITKAFGDHKGTLGATNDQVVLESTAPHLNTHFDGLEPNQPLKVGQRYVLVIAVGAPMATALNQSSRPFEFAFADPTAEVAFLITVDGDPEVWRIKPLEETLILTPPGETKQEAEFVVTALKPCRDKLHISVVQAETKATIQHVWLPVVAGDGGDDDPPDQPDLPPLPRPPVMQAQTSVCLPLDTPNVERRRVEIVIQPQNEAFEAIVRADLLAGTIRETYKLPISGAEIQNATLNLRKKLEGVVFHKHGLGGQVFYPFASIETTVVAEEIARPALVDLADAGQQVWNLIFQGPRAPQGLKRLAADLRELPQGSTIQVIIESQQFIIPWSLLYDKVGEITAETLDYEGFWGYRYIIDVLPPGRYPSPIMNEEPTTLNALFNDDSSLKSFTLAQEERLRQIPSILTVAWGTDEVKKALTQPTNASVIYIYCHGEQVSGCNGKLTSESTLTFSGREHLRLADLRRLLLGSSPFCKQPLVFLNACEGAAQDAFYYDGFMPFFIEELGARGFIGTEVKAPQKLAHDIGLQFLSRLAQGQTVGEILWSLRRFYLKEEHNILAFNYALYCPSEVRFSRPLVSVTA